VFFDRLAEVASEYLRKGSQVYVEGKLRTRKYTDKNGVERYSTEILANEMQMLGSRAQGGSSGGSRAAPAADAAPSTHRDEAYDDDIPF